MELSGRGWGRPQEITLHLIVRAFSCWSSLDKIPMLILSNYFTIIADLFFKLIEPRNFLLKGKHVRGMLGWHLSSKNFCLGCVVLMCNDLSRVKYSLGMGGGGDGIQTAASGFRERGNWNNFRTCFSLFSSFAKFFHIMISLWMKTRDGSLNSFCLFGFRPTKSLRGC